MANIPYRLPEVASLMAIHLRSMLGDRHWFARVILGDDRENDGRPYILIGRLVVGDEIEEFYVTPPTDDRRDHVWRICKIVHHAGTRYDPPSSDILDLGGETRIEAVFTRIVSMVFGERLAHAEMDFHYDYQHMEELFELPPVRIHHIEPEPDIDGGRPR